MWNDTTRTLYYQVGHRRRQRQDRRRSRHLAAAAGRRHLRRHRDRRPLHPQPAGVPGQHPRRTDQPEPRRPGSGRTGACATRSTAPATRRTRTSACSPPSTCSTWPTPRRRHRCSPSSRSASTRRPSGATTSNSARPNSTSHWPPGTPPAGLPHTDPTFYLQSAATWANAYITGPGDAADSLNLYDVSGLAHYELANAITRAGNPAGLATSVAALTADLKKQLDKAVAQSATDPFGFGFPWATYDTTSHGAGLAVMAREYDHLTATTTYAAVADRWLGNILGANAWGLSLIVGDGSTFPHCLQHQVANLVGSLTGGTAGPRRRRGGGPELRRHPRAGHRHDRLPGQRRRRVRAVQRRGAEFKDDMQSYSNTEPAVDLTATSPLAFAWQMSGA